MIEAGCLCRVVNASIKANEGLIVTVLLKCHKYTRPYWHVDVKSLSTDGSISNEIGEHQLQRIDEGNKKISWEEMEGLWVPDLVEALLL